MESKQCETKSTDILKKICLNGLGVAFDINSPTNVNLSVYANCINPPKIICGQLDAAARAEEKSTSLLNDSRVNAFYADLKVC